MKKEKLVKVAVITDSNINGFYDALGKLPDDWDVMIAPTSRFSDILKFKPNVVIYRGSLEDPILEYIKSMEIPKILLLPVGKAVFWQTITPEPDWFELDEKKLKQVASVLERHIRALIN